MAKGKGPKEAFVEPMVLAHTWAGVVWHCESRALVHAAYSLFEKDGWAANAARFINMIAYIAAWFVLCGRCWSFFAEA